MTEMTEERLAAYRGLRDQIRETGEDDEFADAVDEIDRLRAELAATKAENERMRVALMKLGDYRECLNYPGTCQVATSPGGHEDICPVSIAFNALNPEPAP